MKETIEAFRSRLDGDTLGMIDRLRSIIQAADPRLVERIKWNAPSYAIDDDDRITLGLERKGGVRLVLHRGAKAQPAGHFSFNDPDGLVRWPAPDRGVIVWRNAAAIDRVEQPLTLLCRRWIEESSDNG